MKIVWTDRAKARLKKIDAEIAEDAPKAADDLVRRLFGRSPQRQTVARSGRKVQVRFLLATHPALIGRELGIVFGVIAAHLIKQAGRRSDARKSATLVILGRMHVD